MAAHAVSPNPTVGQGVKTMVSQAPHPPDGRTRSLISRDAIQLTIVKRFLHGRLPPVGQIEIAPVVGCPLYRAPPLGERPSKPPTRAADGADQMRLHLIRF